MNPTSDSERTAEQFLEDLQERAKELNCLYRVDEILSGRREQEATFQDLITAIPPGWKYPEICQARLVLRGHTFEPDGYVVTPWSLTAAIALRGEAAGEITVSYTEERPPADEGPFLKEERRLIHAIAERIGLYVMQRQLREDRESWQSVVEQLSARDGQSWKVLVEFLLRTDRELLHRIARKLINQLVWNGVTEARDLLHEGLPEAVEGEACRAGPGWKR